MRPIMQGDSKSLLGKIFGKLLVLVFLLFWAAIPRSLASDIPYTFTTIDFPGATLTQTFGVNNLGQIVGIYYDAGGVLHGFLLDGDNFTTIDFPGATLTEAFGINDLGQIVGLYDNVSGLHGFLLVNDGTFTPIDFPGVIGFTAAFGINNKGQIVGYSGDASGVHGFLLDGDGFSTSDFPGTNTTQGFGVNNVGQIVGSYSDVNRVHGFLFDGTNFTPIDFPGSTYTQAYGINNVGQIVGSLEGGTHGFLLDAGHFTPIEFPGTFGATQAFGINDAGQIAGSYSAEDGYHGFVATPPEEILVVIDIKPGSDPNSINLRAMGTVPVAILSTATFDATTVDPTTVTLASAPVELSGKASPMASSEDINSDGLLDLVVHVDTTALQLSETDTQAILTGETFSGTPVQGSDSVRIIP